MKKTVLIYNNYQKFPFQASLCIARKGWTVITTPTKWISSDIVFIHLQSLTEQNDITKKPGQVWIGWKSDNEEWLLETSEEQWNTTLDFNISFSLRKMDIPFSVSYYNLGKVYESTFDEILHWTRKVDFMIIGTQKGGTTALHKYLSQHRSCWGSKHKEPGFFLFPNISALGFPWYISIMWEEQIPYCRTYNSSLLFESSTWYCCWAEVAERLYEYNPNLKFIFLLRDPVERAFSQYNMLLNCAKEMLMFEYSLYKDQKKLSDDLDMLLNPAKYPFEYWVNLEMTNIKEGKVNKDSLLPDFLSRGIYYWQLENYYKHFSASNILLLESQSLKNNKIETLRNIEKFLNIPSTDWETVDLQNKFVSKYRTKLSNGIKEKMYNFFQPYNERLYQMIGRDLNWGYDSKNSDLRPL